MARASIGILAAVLLVAACGDRQPSLMNIRNADRGPDEFGIIPTKPLEDPPSLAELPVPTPGARNRVDPTPEADAVVALGGRPGVVTTRAAADGALVNYSGRYGVSPSIRTELARADAEFRNGNRGKPLERLFNLTTYYRVYEPFSLDQERELDRFRRAGVPTPAAPPADTSEFE